MSDSRLLDAFGTNSLGDKVRQNLLKWPLEQPATTDVDGPSRIRWRSAPQDYADIYRDVARATSLAIIATSDIHYSLYGHSQGRAILARLRDGVRNIFFISPSHGKDCGIGEYGRYLASKFAELGHQVTVFRTSDALFDLQSTDLDAALVLVNHGPGLFDGINARLSQGESTIKLLQNLDRLATEYNAIPIVLHHSFVDERESLLFSRQQELLHSGIPDVSFVSAAGKHFFLPVIELGVSPVKPPSRDYDNNRTSREEVVGFFGFYQYGGKDFDSLFHLAKQLRAKLVGSVATSSNTDQELLEESLEKNGVSHEITAGWLDDEELLDRLQSADYFYLPQHDYDHWNNSATARFVANLDRPIFLPPHQPFLDMADAVIFATKEDLPRIVAYVREQDKYEQAVARVRAFRQRADMTNTARSLTDTLIEQVESISVDLLEGGNELSAERFLELDASRQAAFGKCIAVETSHDFYGIVRQLKSLYRSVPPRQYWRKHYELGDFAFGSLLESVHASYMNICKRHPTFQEVLELAALSEQLQDKMHGFGHTVRHAMLKAFASRGGTFYDPEVLLLRDGEVADWGASTDPANIETAVAGSRATRRIIRTIQSELDPVRPRLTNILELLLLPPTEVALRISPVDVSGLDMELVQAPRRLVDRLNRLLDECNTAGLDLTAGFVLDHLQVQPVAPKTDCYVLQDFIFFSGDGFLLNAIRCVDKREPFPIEMIALNSLVEAVGKIGCLRYLLGRAQDRVVILNLDHPGDDDLLRDDFSEFISSVRDPLCGLFEARNSYEVLRRYNERWWLKTKTEVDDYWREAGQRIGHLNLLYAALTNTLGAQPSDVGQVRNIASYMLPEGYFMDLTPGPEHWAVLRQDEPLLTRYGVGDLVLANLHGFYDPEGDGVWVKGISGCLVLYCILDEPPPASAGQPTIALGISFYGSEVFGPRELTVAINYLDQDGAWSRAIEKLPVERDQFQTVQATCNSMAVAGPVLIELSITNAISPLSLGRNDDPRELAIKLHHVRLTRISTSAERSDGMPEPTAGIVLPRPVATIRVG
jgi:hypothetical protein